MRVQAVTDNGALVHLDEDELLLLNNALNEVCHALDVREFAVRMGSTQETAERLLTGVGALCGQVDAAKNADRLPNATSNRD
jgi:hypothetical protein